MAGLRSHAMVEAGVPQAFQECLDVHRIFVLIHCDSSMITKRIIKNIFFLTYSKQI